MAEDGSIRILTSVDDAKAQRDLNKLNSKISEIKKNLIDLNNRKVELRVKAKDISGQLDRAKFEYDIMTSKGANFTKEEISAQKDEVKRLQQIYNSVENEIDKIDKKIEKQTLELNKSQEKAGILAKKIAEANTPAAKFARGMNEADAAVNKLTKRIIGLAKRVFFFSLITQGLRGLRTWLGNVINTSDEAQQAMNRLRGALLTMVQPLVNVIIPAFIKLVNVLTQVILQIASLVAMLFGGTLAKSAEDAKALSDNMNKTAGSAKKAKKQLAGFDELNILSGDDSGGGGGAGNAPLFDFDKTAEDEGLLKRILALVELIGSALLGWKLGKMLGLDLTESLGLILAIYSAIQFIKAYMDAWNNGVNFDNLNKMILSLTGVVLGLYVAFGSTGAAIGLVVGGIAMLVLGVKDAIQNGANWANVLTMIMGIMATGLGIAVLTGSFIPLLIAGILSVILIFAQWAGTTDQLIGNIKQIFTGLVQFIKGVFTGDLSLALEGVKNIFKGIINTMLTIVGSFVNAVIRGINWLIDKINTIDITIPDWVPAIGGKGFKPNLQRVNSWNIPQLASGAVVPPNREFMAMLGDNKKETEIVSPLSTMKQALLEALRESGGGGNPEIKLYLDGKQIAINQVKYMRNIERANG